MIPLASRDFAGERVFDPLVQRKARGIARHRHRLRSGEVREDVHHQIRIGQAREKPEDFVRAVSGVRRQIGFASAEVRLAPKV